MELGAVLVPQWEGRSGLQVVCRGIGHVNSGAMLAVRSPEPTMFGSAPCRLPYNRVNSYKRSAGGTI